MQLSDFFLKNKKTLCDLYPGLQLKRLEQLFSECGDQNHYQIYQKLLKGIPLEYISGKAFFFEHEFLVSTDTLIPRFETELLVERAVNWIKKQKDVRVLDIGTGSGCIVLSLIKKCPLKISKAVATDLSSKALSISKTNAEILNLQCKVNWIETDLMDGVDEEFDLIVCNPPYIQMGDEIHYQVEKYEPKMALYVKENYQHFFKRLLSQAMNNLSAQGLFIMEGSENHLESIFHLTQIFDNFKWSLEKDLSGSLRFLVGEGDHG